MLKLQPAFLSIRLGLLLAALLALLASASAAEPPANEAVANAPQRLREGSRLTDVAGRFDFVGDRIAFYPAGSKDSYRLSENLAAERIHLILTEGSAKQTWLVSGSMTEFRGSNFLQVTKAVIRLDQTEAAARPNAK